MAIAETQVYMPQAPRPKLRLLEDERFQTAEGLMANANEAGKAVAEKFAEKPSTVQDGLGHGGSLGQAPGHGAVAEVRDLGDRAPPVTEPLRAVREDGELVLTVVGAHPAGRVEPVAVGQRPRLAIRGVERRRKAADDRHQGCQQVVRAHVPGAEGVHDTRRSRPGGGRVRRDRFR